MTQPLPAGSASRLLRSSTAARGMRWGRGILGAGLLMAFAPFFLAIDGMDGGFALNFVGGFIVISGIVTILVFGAQQRAVRRTLENGGLLVHWRYPDADWRRFVEEEYRESSTEKRLLLRVVGIIMLLVGAGFILLAHDEASAWVAGALLGTFALCWVAARLVPALQRRRNLKQPGEVLIGTSMASINGALHTWGVVGARLESAGIREEDRRLVITYSFVTRQGRETAEVRIPIPPGADEEARGVVAALSGA